MFPLLRRPRVDPPEVTPLLDDIKGLEGISGTAALIEQKRALVNELRSADTITPGWLLIGALRSPTLWLQSDERLNLVLRQLVTGVTVQLVATVADGRVKSVRCRTAPSEAPLPPDQTNIRIRRGLVIWCWRCIIRSG